MIDAPNGAGNPSDQPIQLFMKQRICLVILIHTGMKNYPP